MHISSSFTLPANHCDGTSSKCWLIIYPPSPCAPQYDQFEAYGDIDGANPEHRKVEEQLRKQQEDRNFNQGPLLRNTNRQPRPPSSAGDGANPAGGAGGAIGNQGMEATGHRVRIIADGSSSSSSSSSSGNSSSNSSSSTGSAGGGDGGGQLCNRNNSRRGGRGRGGGGGGADGITASGTANRAGAKNFGRGGARTSTKLNANAAEWNGGGGGGGNGGGAVGGGNAVEVGNGNSGGGRGGGRGGDDGGGRSHARKDRNKVNFLPTLILPLEANVITHTQRITCHSASIISIISQAKVGNHNRKLQAAKKLSKGMV